MRLRSRSYERFGSYLLLRKLETSPIGDCWRAAPIEGLKLGPAVALRRFPAGDLDLWRPAIEELNTLTPFSNASSIVRRQRAEISGSTPFLAHPWEGGRPLSVIAERAFSAQGALMPVPVDLALAIAEKIAHSLTVTHGTKHKGSNSVHGAVLPEMVWVSEDGETRVAGQGLGRPLAPLAAHSAQLRPFIAPEVVAGGSPEAASDVYSAGAILLFLLAGRTQGEGVANARVLATSQKVAPEIARILELTLAPDPARRCDSPTLHRELAALINSSAYSATTFNLAYFVQSLLRSDLEAERKERESESQINIATATSEERAEAPVSPTPQAILTAPSTASASSSRRWVAIGIFAVVFAAGAGAVWYASKTRPSNPPVASAPAPTATPRPVSSALPSPSAAPIAAPVAVDDSATRAAAFEREVNRRLREEMTKLQQQFDEEQRRNEAKARAAAQREPARVLENPAREPAQEGQLFDLREVDQAPTVLRATAPDYPDGAGDQNADISVIVTALISETGRVLDARVLRGSDSSLGYDGAALSAVRLWDFAPAVKDGQRVRSWVPVSVNFPAR